MATEEAATLTPSLVNWKEKKQLQLVTKKREYLSVALCVSIANLHSIFSIQVTKKRECRQWLSVFRFFTDIVFSPLELRRNENTFQWLSVFRLLTCIVFSPFEFRRNEKAVIGFLFFDSLLT